MWKFLKAILFVIAGIVFGSPAFSEEFIYSHQFEQRVGYITGSPQFDDWLSYRASLPTSGTTSITVSGSRDPAGRTCSDPAIAQQIVDAMIAGASGITEGTVTLNLSCDGFNWNTGSCSNVLADANNLELNVGPAVTMCGCGAVNYTVRPGISGGTNINPNWGGIAGPTCTALSQTMTVTVNSNIDTDTDGVLDGDDLCPGTVPNDPVDAAGCSDAQVDADGDGACNLDAAHGGPSMCVGIDNCPVDFNPEQEDLDDNTIGDACDDDIDGDGVPNNADPHPRSDLSPTVVINGCNSGVANDILPSGSSISDLVTDAFNAGGEDAVEDLEDDGTLSEYKAEAIEDCLEDDEDDEDDEDEDDDD